MDGYGYIILSDAGIFKNLADNAKIIYDMMTYVYFNSYIETKYTSSWITDEKIDFIGHFFYLSFDAAHRKHWCSKSRSLVKQIKIIGAANRSFDKSNLKIY